MKVNHRSYMKRVVKLIHKCEIDESKHPAQKEWVKSSYYLQIKAVVNQYEQEKDRADNINRLGAIASGDEDP